MSKTVSKILAFCFKLQTNTKLCRENRDSSQRTGKVIARTSAIHGDTWQHFTPTSGTVAPRTQLWLVLDGSLDGRREWPRIHELTALVRTDSLLLGNTGSFSHALATSNCRPSDPSTLRFLCFETGHIVALTGPLYLSGFAQLWFFHSEFFGSLEQLWTKVLVGVELETNSLFLLLPWLMAAGPYLIKETQGQGLELGLVSRFFLNQQPWAMGTLKRVSWCGLDEQSRTFWF